MGYRSVPVPPPAAGPNDFAFDLFRQVGAGHGRNLVVSPKAVRDALALLCPAARGVTAAAFRYVCRLPNRPDQAADGLTALIATLRADRGGEVRAAVGLWVQTGWPFDREYVRLVEGRLGGRFAAADHRDRSAHPAIAAAINGRVERLTAGTIRGRRRPPGSTRRRC